MAISMTHVLHVRQAGNKENLSVNQAAPNRSQGKRDKHANASSAGEAESCAIDHAFVKAVLAAAQTAQVSNIWFVLLFLPFSVRCSFGLPPYKAAVVILSFLV